MTSRPHCSIFRRAITADIKQLLSNALLRMRRTVKLTEKPGAEGALTCWTACELSNLVRAHCHGRSWLENCMPASSVRGDFEVWGRENSENR